MMKSESVRICPICHNKGVEETTTTLNKNCRTHRPCARCEELKAKDLRPVLAISSVVPAIREMVNLALSMPPDWLDTPDGRKVGIVNWRPIAPVDQDIVVEAEVLVKTVEGKFNQTHSVRYLESYDGRFFDILEWAQVETKKRGWGEPTVWFKARVLVPWPANYGPQEPLKDS